MRYDEYPSENCRAFFCTGSLNAHAQLNPFSYDNIKTTGAEQAAVDSAHALASDAGLQVMEQGGNAFDSRSRNHGSKRSAHL